MHRALHLGCIAAREKSQISDAFEFDLEIARGMTTPEPALWDYRSFPLAKPRISHEAKPSLLGASSGFV